MQINSFLGGVLVASLGWLTLPALADLDWFSKPAASPQAGMSQAKESHAVVLHGMSAEQQAAHVAELKRRWQAMTPAEREAHPGTAQCPYAGRAQHGGGRAGEAGRAQGLRPQAEPLGT